MSVKDIGERSVWQLLNRKKGLAVIAISITGMLFGFLLFFLLND